MSMATAEHVKRSHGLTQFVSSIRDESGLSILDFGGICQENVSFITGLGHRLHSEDFLRTLDDFSHEEDLPGGPSQKERIAEFLDETLGFSTGSLNGVLAWDTLQYLSRPLLLSTIDRLFEVLDPGAYLLALFHTTEQPQEVPIYSYRINDAETLHLVPRGVRQPVQFFNNRGIEKLFERFQAVKFFLTRDNFREVIVKR